MKLIRVLALIFVAAGFACAQEMTLAEMEAVALKNGPEIDAVVKRVEVLESRVAGAGAFDDPSVMYRGWGVPVLQPWNVNQAQHMFMFTENVPGPGKRALRYLIAAQGVDVAKLEIEAKKREITARVRNAFYQLLLTYDRRRLHDEQIALANQAVAASRIKYTVGRVPQQDVLKAQVALTRLADHLVMIERDAEMARTALNTLMGRDPATPLEVRGEHSIPGALPSSSELQKIALENRPELLAFSSAIKQSQTKTQLAEKAYTPDFAIGAGYMLMPPGSASRHGYMAELSMTLPWLNRGKHDSEIREARAEVEVIQAEYRNQAAQVSRQIREEIIQAESAKRLVELYKDTLRPQARSTLRAASAAYQTDQTDFLNLLDSQNVAIDVEAAYFRALSEYESRLADLEQAIGTALPRGGANDRP